ncbi:MAG: hypothetical protein HY329_22120 [Chloroflexi bacterium]|nr:hypothetical protein [Chloroflexota bacterium]
MTDEATRARLEALERENAELRAKAEGRSFSLKDSEKGGVSAYGLGRWPVTLYAEQWTTLLDHADDIRRFIAEYSAELKKKEAAS